MLALEERWQGAGISIVLDAGVSSEEKIAAAIEAAFESLELGRASLQAILEVLNLVLIADDIEGSDARTEALLRFCNDSLHGPRGSVVLGGRGPLRLVRPDLPWSPRCTSCAAR